MLTEKHEVWQNWAHRARYLMGPHVKLEGFPGTNLASALYEVKSLYHPDRNSVRIWMTLKGSEERLLPVVRKISRPFKTFCVCGNINQWQIFLVYPLFGRFMSNLLSFDELTLAVARK